MVDIKIRYYDRDGNEMYAEYSSSVIPRKGEKVYLGREGEGQSYYVHSVSHYPGDNLNHDIYIIARKDRPPSHYR